MLALRDGVLHGKHIVEHIGPLEPEDESEIKEIVMLGQEKPTKVSQKPSQLPQL